MAKSKTIRCSVCGGDEFMVTTLGIEICAGCYHPTMNFHPEPTGRLSYRQDDQARELEDARQRK